MLLEKQNDWKATAGELLKVLNATATEEMRKEKDWPTTPRGMSGAIRRVAPGLRKLSYTVEFGERDPTKNRNRLIRLGAPVDIGRGPSEPCGQSKWFWQLPPRSEVPIKTEVETSRERQQGRAVSPCRAQFTQDGSGRSR
jgi:hypothetical protein